MSKLRTRPWGSARSSVLVLMALVIMATVAGLMAHSFWAHQQAQTAAPVPGAPDQGLPGPPHQAWGGPEWGRHEWGQHPHEGGHHQWAHHDFTADGPPPDGDGNGDRCRRHHGHRHHGGPQPATVTGLTDMALTEQNEEGWSKTVVLNDSTRYWQSWDGPQVTRAQMALGQVVMVREDVQKNGLACAADVTILEQPEQPAGVFMLPAISAAAVATDNTPPDKPFSPLNDMALRWLGFGGLMAGLVEAERRRRRRRRQPKE